MSRNIRTFSSLHRFLKPTPSLYRHNGDVRVRHVRIVRPWFTVRKTKQITLCLALAGFTWHRLGKLEDEEDEGTKTDQIKEAVQQVKVSSEAGKLGPGSAEAGRVDSNEVDVVDEVDDDDLVPEEQPEDAWFIPLGIARQVPQTFYKGEDPEWQSFIEFASDRKRGGFVRNELAGYVGEYVGGLSNFQKFLGTPITTGTYWLDIDFPDGPPPEYERAGIEITEDYIAYTVRPVDPLNVSRLQSALWPTATGASLWASCSAYLKLHTARIKKALNMEDSTRKTPSSGYAEVSDVLGKPKSATSHKGPGPRDAQAKPPNLVASKPPPSDSINPDRAWILRPLPGVPQPNTDLSKASTVFRHSLAKNWKNASIPPPRGTFSVSGLVELAGPKGICTLDVRAAYDPRESQWVVIGIAVRRLQKRKQKPKA
ncbi:MAG: hypothetical protein MMC23_005759 [Stictis urceolatum]|nr:hypothetical protein [Stictis urceolata]